MKLFNKILALGLAAVLGLAACEKFTDLPFYNNGVNPVLTSSATTLAPAPGDSLKYVLSLNWTNPNYATDKKSNKYLVQFDSAGRNFGKAVTYTVTGDTTFSILAKDLNNMLLGFGFDYNKQYSIETRVISSYGNNNERHTSNYVKMAITTYKVPPKVALPTSGKLFLVGDASDGGWSNPVPVPTQEFTRIDETNFGGIFHITGGGSYLILPVNGSWDAKYAVADNSIPGLSAGGSFGFNVNGSHNQNFPGPSTDGWYKIMLDFQKGTFTVTPYTQQHGLPQALVAVGDATPNGWANDATNNQTFTRRNSTQWDITIALTAAKSYLILPVPGSWDKKYGVEDNSIASAKLSGFLKPEGQNIPAPDVSGNYKIVVDFINNAYTLTKQ